MGNLLERRITLLRHYYPEPIEFSTDGVARISFKKKPVLNIEYSTDGYNWFSYESEKEIEIDEHTKVYFRGVGNTYINNSGDDGQVSKFSSSGAPIRCRGNIMSLLDYRKNSTAIPVNHCFRYLFQNMKNLVEAPELPATSLTEYCYEYMFKDCFKLVTAPELPSETLAKGCYNYMFANCNSLTVAPQLPAMSLTVNCYKSMFVNCTSLTVAPQLPAMSLAESCYNSMFNGCTSLTIAPELPATNGSAAYCYGGMFSGCTSLTTVPSFSLSNHVGYQSCMDMFSGCINLTTFPNILPAMSLSDACYRNMFYGCFSLKNAPELPATSLTNSCYNCMFQGCTSITTAPELPATTLKDSCYYRMFMNCKSLLRAPELPATTFNGGANYYEMFKGCSKLNYIKCLLSELSTGQTYNWVNGVSPTGTFIANSESNWDAYSVHQIPKYWQSNVELLENYSECLYFSDAVSSQTLAFRVSGEWTIETDCDWISLSEVSGNSVYNEITVTKTSEPPSSSWTGNGITITRGDVEKTIGLEYVGNVLEKYLTIRADDNFSFSPGQKVYNKVQYSLDGGTSWNSFTGSVQTISLTGGSEILFKGNLSGPSNYDKILLASKSTSSAWTRIMIYGNVMSLLYGDNFVGQNEFSSGDQYTFKSLFSGITYDQIDASNLILPATIIPSSSYQNMFNRCNKLVLPPRLPATVLSGPDAYRWMFMGCTSLTTAPELPATALTNNCYREMFSGCTSLTTAPELPATTLAGECYRGMFVGCTNLTTVPELPATTLAGGCYYCMFQGCTSITTAPELPATTLAGECYRGMFQGCTSITTAPELPATTLAVSCYQDMFNGCNNLTVPPVLCATTLSDTCYSGMFVDCVKLRTAPQLPVTTLAYSCYSNMFNGCTSLTAAPELPATNLATSCYWNLFINCKSLRTAPELPATVLEDSCYTGMFGYCISLEEAPELPATVLAPSCYSDMFNNCYLTTAPELPATTLADSCYKYMFSGCTLLTDAPVLFADTLTESCYEGMFFGCNNLSYIEFYGKSVTVNSCTKNWVSGVRPSGTLKMLSNAIPFERGVNGIPIGWNSEYAIGFQIDTKVLDYTSGYTVMILNCDSSMTWEFKSAPSWVTVSPISGDSEQTEITITYDSNDTNDIRNGSIMVFFNDTFKSELKLFQKTNDFTSAYLTFDVLSDGEISFVSTYVSDKTIECSKNDGLTWSTLTANSEGISVEMGDTVIFKGNNDDYAIDYQQYNSFSATCQYNVSGNIQSLYSGDDFITKGGNGKTIGLFTNNYGLLDASNLKLPKTLVDSSFRLMFYGCTGMTQAPQLPATALTADCYREMFKRCTSLTSAPSLPATETIPRCYYQMFYGCSSITTPPSLPASTITDSCYYQMFGECSSLTTAPVLTANTLAGNCYYQMFIGCTGLTGVMQSLPAENLAGRCYQGMFSGCTSLTTAPALPATTLADYCYYEMFADCSSLLVAPVLPATNILNYSYALMFKNCISLTTAPELPGTNIAGYCYSNMFNGCTALTTGPSILPAMSLQANCYQAMFRVCTSLVNSPVLPASTMTNNSYHEMFRYCSSLNHIECYLKNIDNKNSLYYWVGSVANSGTFVKNREATFWERSVFGIPFGWNVETRFGFDVLSFNAMCINGSESVTIYTKNQDNGWEITSYPNWITPSALSGIGETQITISYSENPNDEDRTGVIVLESDNQQATLQVIQAANNSHNQPLTFEILTNGNITLKSTNNTSITISYTKNNGLTWSEISFKNNILGYDTINVEIGDSIKFIGNNNRYATSEGDYRYFETTCGFNLSGNIQSLTNYSDSTSAFTFFGMFSGCDKLIHASGLTLPQMVLTPCCYRCLFLNCTNLLSAPDLPATGLSEYCYYQMFRSCSSLVTATSLPATELAGYCYGYMFSGCISLTYAPSLPATVVPRYGYIGMFKECNSLVTAPDLPATTLNEHAYDGMFYPCTALTTVPVFSATTLIGTYQCSYMFAGCISLTSVPSILPALTVTDCCYQYMFSGCTNLGSSPILPAETLVGGCYRSMFSNCTVLSDIRCLAMNNTTGNTAGWVSGVAYSGHFTKHILNNSWIYTLSYTDVSSIPTGWEIVNYGDNLRFTAIDSISISFTNDLYYSFDGYSYELLEHGNEVHALSGETVWFKGNITPTQASGVGTFTTSGRFYVSGLVASLLYGDMRSNEPNINVQDAYAFKNLFSGCTGLTSVSGLGLTNVLSTGCYQNMFRGCTSLAEMPDLVSTTLEQDCYNGMFAGCTSLVDTVTLPATDLVQGCYNEMFDGCTSLTGVSAMFITEPGSDYTHNWLRNVGETGTFNKNPDGEWELIGYDGIPSGWTIQGEVNYYLKHFTTTALETGTITLRIGKNVSASKLSYVAYSLDNGETWTTTNNVTNQVITITTPTLTEGQKVLWRGSGSSYTNETSPQYANNVDQGSIFSSTCRFNVSGNLASMFVPEGFYDLTINSISAFSSVFWKCNKVIDASNLIIDCRSITKKDAFNDMFNSCTALIAGPQLKTLALYESCYKRMFKGCSSLREITMLATSNIGTNNSLQDWVSGVPNNVGTFYKSSNTNWNTSGASGIPNGWTVVSI